MADSINETLQKNEHRQKEETEQQIALVRGTYESKIFILKGLWNDQNKAPSTYAIDESTEIVDPQIEELRTKLLMAEQREQTTKRL